MKIPFFVHFNELKLRSFFIFLSFLFSLCVSFSDPFCVLFIFIRPLWIYIQGPFLFTHPLEGIHASILAQILLGFLFSFPVFIYHFWSFFSSSLFAYEKRTLTRLLICFGVIFIVGFSFFYFVILPIFCEFFLSYSSSYAVLEPRVLEYLFFFIKFFSGAILFLVMPFILFLVSAYWGTDPKEIESKRSWAILFSALFGAFLSPPEVMSQVFIGLSFYFWYEVLVLGLWIYWVNLKSKK